jgi:IPT/TIG domain/Glucose / Sorbosone dehydrogenase
MLYANGNYYLLLLRVFFFSLGLAFDPLDVKSNPDVYFTANRFFHKGTQSSSGTTISGKIKRASGPNLEIVIDIITGLPTSDLDHGLNALEFGDNGELYFNSGSHTNGGKPGQLSSSKLLQENFLSAAVNVAYLSHPDFNGEIKWSAPDDGNMISKGIDLFAMGLRNPYGLVMHSNGRLYCTDNGPNKDYGRMSTGCNGESIEDARRDDEINLLEKGKYYGHPNPKRASYLNDPRQCVWQPPENPDSNKHTAPILIHPSSIDGIMEFHSNHFSGILRRNLLYIRYGGEKNIYRIVLNADGRGVLPSLNGKGIEMNIGHVGLDLTQAPNGNLVEMRYEDNTVFVYKPVEPNTNALVAKTCFPRRGRSSGGNTLSVYGENFTAKGPTVLVTVGGINCPTTFVSSTRVDCTLPGGTGTVDIVVQNGAASSTFDNGYRYVSGTVPPGFVLPVYTG